MPQNPNLDRARDHRAALCVISNPQLSLAVAPDVGAGIVWLRSMKDGHITWRWLREAQPEEKTTTSNLGCFLLAPFSNRIAFAKFNWMGQERSLLDAPMMGQHAIHGNVWTAAWDVIEHAPEAVELAIDKNGTDWPWAFQARVRYSLVEKGVRARLSLRNQSNTAMPSGLGFHPYFPVSDDVTLQADVAAMVTNSSLMLPEKLSFDAPSVTRLRQGAVLPMGLDNGFARWSGKATICWTAANKALQIETEPQAKWAVLYTPVGRDFFCFEPVTHQTNAHNMSLEGVSDTGLIALPPGHEQEITMIMSLKVQ
ncbi:MAG: aldose 1-epimerase [Hyphomicrobiaceae bacterium]